MLKTWPLVLLTRVHGGSFFFLFWNYLTDILSLGKISVEELGDDLLRTLILCLCSDSVSTYRSDNITTISQQV